MGSGRSAALAARKTAPGSAATTPSPPHATSPASKVAGSFLSRTNRATCNGGVPCCGRCTWTVTGDLPATSAQRRLRATCPNRIRPGGNTVPRHGELGGHVHVAGAPTSRTWQVLTPGGTQACARSTSQTWRSATLERSWSTKARTACGSRRVPASTRAIEARLPATGPIRGLSPLVALASPSGEDDSDRLRTGVVPIPPERSSTTPGAGAGW